MKKPTLSLDDFCEFVEELERISPRYISIENLKNPAPFVAELKAMIEKAVQKDK